MRRLRTRTRGFTLVELLVSLTAGLIIAIAVAGLAKVATNTFYEESRVQVAELSLRIAVDRLRADLSRASYMGTSNLLADPLTVKPSGQAAVTVPAQFANGMGLLAGVRLFPNGTIDGGTIDVAKLTSDNLGAGVVPDRLVIGGNMTTSDEYIVQSVQANQGCGGSGTTITLSLDSPAISRLLRDASGALLPAAAATTALTAAFAPVSVTSGTQPTWMARIVDDSGRHQFVALCAAATGSAVTVAGGVPQIIVQGSTPVLSASQTSAQGGTSGFGVGRLTINPVQLVEWSVRGPAADAPAPPNWAADSSPDAATKLVLSRQYLDATGARVGNPEQVAEYVVDFEIAFVSENSSPTATPRMTLTAFDQTTDANAAVTASTTQGPQWVRSLRYRMATRAPIADRELPLASPTTGYAYRYCVDTKGCTDSRRYARVRTLTGEVTLMNQTRYP